MAVDQQKMRMLAALLRTPKQSETMNALAQRYANPPPSNWLSKPLPMEGRFNLLPIREEVPGMGPSVFNKRSAALPGVLAAAVNAFTAPGRAMSGPPGFDPKAEGFYFGGTFMGSGLLGSRMAPAPRGSIGMNAYHGSPHIFEKFDINKIGTGEGAQAFGHGLYFSETPGVAHSYRSALADAPEFMIGSRNVGKARNSETADAARFLFDAKGDAAAALAKVQRLRDGGSYPYSSKVYVERLTRAISENAGAEIKQLPQGALYHVDIPDEAIGRMLDWDKPLSQQPQSVQDGWVRAMQKRMGRTPQVNFNSFTGKQAYDMLSGGALGMHGFEDIAARASKDLRDAGIPGIRYLDQGSRAGGDGTRNFVLFDDKLAKITKRE
jgi:hypothetical protein